MPRLTQYLQPAVAGLLIGLIGFFGFPQIMGAGYEYIDQAMHNQFTWEMLGILAGLKIVATTLSFVSGTPGGMFAPTPVPSARCWVALFAVSNTICYPILLGRWQLIAWCGWECSSPGFSALP